MESSFLAALGALVAFGFLYSEYIQYKEYFCIESEDGVEELFRFICTG